MKSKILFIALIGVILTTHTQTKIGFDINDAFTVSGNSVAHYGMSRISGNDYHYVGLSGFFGLNFYTNGKERIKVNRDGYVGIGTTNPVNTLQVGDGPKASFNVSGNAGKTDWTRSYTVSNTSISPLLGPTGTALDKGGAYRFTGHIFSTGTDQSSRTVFWNKNNKWYVNVTSQSGTKSNHIHFLVHNGVPSVKTFHPNGYIVSVWHERINLNENAGTDNTRHYFGADAYMSQIGENILMNYGNVGIGTTTPDPNSKLTVAGKIHSQEVKVTATAGGADFVFENTYPLPTLKEVEQFITKNKHLPEIASAKEMEKNGIHLAEMNIKLLQKIEELTLYTIQQQKDLEAQQEQLEVQQEQNRTTETRLKALEALLQAD